MIPNGPGVFESFSWLQDNHIPFPFHEETIGATVVQSKAMEAVEAASSEKLKDPSRTRARDAESFARGWTLDSIRQT
jgi:hypothetical protein